MLQRPTLTLGTVGLLLFGAVSATQAAEFGTREDANAMLDKAIAAVKEDKEKALAMFNNGESGFKDRDLYVLCANASDGTIMASPSSNGQHLTDFAPGKRDNVLVATSWLHKATQETYLLYESWRS